jgi:hypothetical protein
MIGYGRVTRSGYCAAHSADGLRWTLYPVNPILPGGDTCTLAHDPVTGDYLAFHKRTHKHRGHNRRLVYLATSRDMQQWSEPRLVMAPDATDDAQTRAGGGICSQFYNMSAFRRGTQWIGLVTHFRYAGRPAVVRGPSQSLDDGPIDVQLVHSRDGRTWQRCDDRSPVIPIGPHAYDAGCVLGVANAPVVVGDELWIYYTAVTTTHGGAFPDKRISVALAKWRLDGFVSLDAGPSGGTIETLPLRCPAARLVLNADASRGLIRVEALDDAGVPLDGYSADDCIELRNDAIRHTVRWQQRDTLPRNPSVRLRFHLRDASLFSFQLAPTGE